MGKYCDRYSYFDIDNNHMTAITLLNGFLGDAVSDEKKKSILKKLSLPYMMKNGRAEEAKAMYPRETGKGGKFYDAMVAAENEELEIKETEGPAKGVWKQRSFFINFTDERMEPVMEEYHKGMGELMEVLEEHAKDIKNIKEPNANNHFNLLYKQLKDSYDGTLNQKLQDNAWYGEAIAMTAKVAFPSTTINVNVETGEITIPKMNGEPVDKVLREMADIGFLEMLSGGARLQQKEEECVKNGKVSRQELLHEYAEQKKRTDKVFAVSEDKANDLVKKNVLQNPLDEITGGDRGVNCSVWDMEGRRLALEMGYPVADLPVISAFYMRMRSIERQIPALEKQLAGNAKEDAKQLNRETLEKITAQKEFMDAQWEIICGNAGPLTDSKRIRNLMRLQACVKTMHEDYPNLTGLFNDYEKRVEERINADLSNGDKAMLANDTSSMYEALKEVDPKTLFTSSKQFDAFKDALKELVEFEAQVDMDDEYQRGALFTRKREVMKKAQDYLRYKDRQINGPKGKNHKRSELEAKRVQTVDGIYNRLFSDVKREAPELKLNDSEKAVVSTVDNKRLMDGPANDTAASFENYMRLHTGKGAMSGTLEEMVDDLAKTLAAQTLSNQNPPKEFDIGELHKAAEQIKKKFDLVNMKPEKLRSALDNPEKAKDGAIAHYRETYGVEPKNYNAYIKSMRALYANMETPAANSRTYRAVFDAVKRAASLPYGEEALKGVDEKKLQNLTADLNANIFAAIDKYVEKHGKGMGPHDDKTLHVLATLSRAVEGADSRVADVMVNIKKAVGITNIGDSRYVDLEHYGRRGSRYKLEKKDTPNELDENMKAELRDQVKTMDETRKDLTKTKEAAKAKPAANEAPAPTTKNKLEKVNVTAPRI